MIVLRDFDAERVSKRRSEDPRKEFARLALLKWLTIARYGIGAEVEATKAVLAEHGQKVAERGTKQQSSADDGPSAKLGRKRLIPLRRSWALPLAGATDYIYRVAMYLSHVGTFVRAQELGAERLV